MSSSSARSAIEPGSWVANFDDQLRPRIARVKDAYELTGESLLDLVLYSHDGTRLGRVSPACGGPTKFEPACSAELWEPIEQPNFERMSEERFTWGRLVHRINHQGPA